MLEEVLTYIHNWFRRTAYLNDWEVSDGSLDLPFLKEGQYYRILGSTFNDGLHQHPATLTDESFHGEIWSLAIPQQIIDLSNEIDDWKSKNGDAADSPYQSESFGGYSYSKGSRSDTDAELLSGWQAAFNSRLIPWRKL